MYRVDRSLPLAQMIRRLDIGRHPALSNAAFIGQLEWVCAGCRSVGVCRHWLDCDRAEAPPAFCPNAVELSAMCAGLSVASGGEVEAAGA